MNGLISLAVDPKTLTCDYFSTSQQVADGQTFRVVIHDVGEIYWRALKVYIEGLQEKPNLTEISGNPDMFNRNCITMTFEVTDEWSETRIHAWLIDLMHPRHIGTASPVGFATDDFIEIRLELNMLLGDAYHWDDLLDTASRLLGITLHLLYLPSLFAENKNCYAIRFVLPLNADPHRDMRTVAKALGLIVPEGVFGLYGSFPLITEANLDRPITTRQSARSARRRRSLFRLSTWLR